jgi:preprotein translocase subunit SecD
MQRLFRISAKCSVVILLVSFSSCGRNKPRPLVPAATVEVFLVAPTSLANTKTIEDPDGKSLLYVTTPAILSASDIATIACDDVSQEPSLNFNCTPQGAKKLLAATTPPSGKQLAIVVNGSTIAAPKLHSPVSNSFNISGGLIFKDRNDIFDALTVK